MIDVFAEHRRLLFSVAYRMTGSAADADDIVQDAWLRWAAAQTETVAQPKAYLVKIVTNLALNQLGSARARREIYIGPWLPEPLLTGSDAVEEVEVAEEVSLAMLVVLEALSPLERAVFVLGDVFGYDYTEIAGMLDRREAAVRQVAHRAREHVRARQPRYASDAATAAGAVERFRAACAGGDLAEVMAMLAPDVTCWADGGGRITAARRPLHGADHVARWLLGVLAKPAARGVRADVVVINGEPALLFMAGDQPAGSMHLEIDGGMIMAIRMVVNPDKLGGLSQSALRHAG